MNRRFQASQDKNIFVQQRQPLVSGPYGKIKQSTPQNVASPVSRSINMHLTPVGGQIQPLPNQPNSHRSLRPKTGENGVFMGKSKIGQQIQMVNRGQSRQPPAPGGISRDNSIDQSKGGRNKPNRSENRDQVQQLEPLTNRSTTGGKLMLNPVNHNFQVPQSHRELLMNNNRPFSHGDNTMVRNNQSQKLAPQTIQNQNQGININIHKYKEKRAAKYNNFNSINPQEF